MAQDSCARNSGDPYRALQDRCIAIENVAGAFRSCRNCQHTLARIDVTPVGMHCGTLKCAACGHLTSYLSIDHLQAMLAAHKAGEGV